ncbi:MAG: rhodanese-like domain-containing protein [Verrucomicrobia bacterium]|nr:rhodanese-like domain-containing protein [Verrucomicrobiota bacterium]
MKMLGIALGCLGGLLVCGCGPAASRVGVGSEPVLAAGTAPAPQVVHVDAVGAQRLIREQQYAVLDVRTPAEYRAGHISGAKNLDFNAAGFEERLAELDRNQAYLVHCASGGRSTKSLAVLRKLGFKSVAHLDGGFRAWEKAGQPVEK